MHQTWGKLLFMHWPIEPEVLRPLVPLRLSLDTFDNKAWIGIVPFTMWDVRASFLPPIPGTSAFHELNVRTYVHHNGVPGVWFFSLDAANALAVWGARTFYHLPYFSAEMSLNQTAREITYTSTRTGTDNYARFFAEDNDGFSADFTSNRLRDAPPAELKTSWNIGESLPESAADSLEFFLTERYCLYAYHQRELSRARIFHPPWPLHSARLGAFESTMIESLGITASAGDPLLHYAEQINVEIWPLEKV